MKIEEKVNEIIVLVCILNNHFLLCKFQMVDEDGKIVEDWDQIFTSKILFGISHLDLRLNYCPYQQY